MVLFGGCRMKNSKIETIPLKNIDLPGEAQRDSIDPSKIIELAESIREKGLIHPILLRPVNGRFEIVAGHRRFLAHQFLNLEVIASMVKEMDDGDVVIYRAIENLQRENLSPLEEARSYNLMREKGGMSVEDICQATGKALSTVKRWLRFYRMPPEFREAVDKGGICLGVAESLIEVDDTFLRSEWLRMAVENGITKAVADTWVSDYQKSKAGKRTEGIGDLGESELNPEPKKVYVTCMVCSDPIEISQAKQIILCKECRKKVVSH
jgi:ParB family chromosome partitioning protein